MVACTRAATAVAAAVIVARCGRRLWGAAARLPDGAAAQARTAAVGTAAAAVGFNCLNAPRYLFCTPNPNPV